MASTKLMQTKDGKQFYQISVSRGYGKSPYKTRWYFPDSWCDKTVKRELSKAVAEFERACSAGEIQNRAEQKEKAAQEAAERAKLKTFRDYSLDVFMATKEQSFSENARSSYLMFFEKHLFPVFGDTLLVEISTAMINKFLLGFQKQGYKQATATKLYNIMNGVFTMAFMDDSIPTNPMLKAYKPKASKDETAHDKSENEKALTVEQLKNVLSCVEHEDLKWKTFICLLAETGMRRGEACGLQWQDIDFDNNLIHIRRNLQYTPAAGVYETTPKNGKSREVDIEEFEYTEIIDGKPEKRTISTSSLLRQLREEQSKSCISKWVFTQPGTAEPMHPQSPTRYFTKFGKKYGIANFHPHLLRHTSASILITSGADVVSTSERLGHSDTSVTLKMYAHANQDSIRRAGQIGRDALKNA